jgi:hypothetical protein
MRHLIRYDGYTSKERLDECLDKISKYGFESLSDLEIEFLDSHKIGNQEEVHIKLAKLENETVFEDDNGLFKFEFQYKKTIDDNVYYTGILYVPDLILNNGKRIEGRLSGNIIVYKNGTISPDFYSIQKDTLTNFNYGVLDFCGEKEDELDLFIDYVVYELSSKK